MKPKIENGSAKQIFKVLDQINERLDTVEQLTAFAIPARLRFKRGQRVRFSALADRKQISRGKKGGVRRGTVVKTQDFIVTVLLDGHKKPSGYFHAFFEPVSGSARK